MAIDLAELLAARLEVLLVAYPMLAPAARADVVGAARYFISSGDAQPDAAACTGLDDDDVVFNLVALRLGRSDLVIHD